MTIATATISGQFVGPDLTGGHTMSATYEAYAVGTVVTYPGLGVIGGRLAVPIQKDGTATVTIPTIPQAGLLPASGVMWKVRVHVRGEVLEYFFPLTADTTWDAVLVPSNTLAPPGLAGEAVAARDAAIAARDAAQAAAASTVLYAPAPIGGTSDDLAALNTVLSAFGANGGTLYLRGGTYLLSNTLTIPNKVNAIGVGRSGTFLKAHSTFPTTGVPLVALGPSGLAFSSRLERASVDCNNVAGSSGVYSFQGQEMCGVDKVAVSNFKDTGIHFDTGASNFTINDVECYPSSTGANYGIHLHNAGSQVINKPTVGVQGLLTAGIFVNSGEATIIGAHVENCTDGILFDNSRGVVIGATGPTVTANVTNLIRMASNSRYVTVIDATKNSATNTVRDDFFNRTITDAFVQLAVLGDQYVARLHHVGDTLGFFNTTPVNKAAAITATPAAAPAGGTGTAAGGWDTAANRDLAIATINGLRTTVADMKARLVAYGLFP